MYKKRPVDYLNEVAAENSITPAEAMLSVFDAASPMVKKGLGMNASAKELLDDWSNRNVVIPPDAVRDLVDESNAPKGQRRTYMTIEFVRNVDGDYKTEKVCGYLPADDVLRDPLIVDFLSANITEGGVTKLMLIPRRNINTVRVYDAND